jgi:hypothetical protein
MFTRPRLTARLAVIIPFAALLAAACNTDANGPSSPALLAHRQGGGGAAGSGFAVLANAAVTCTDGTITGDVGTFQATPTGSITLTTCPLTGTGHVGDAAAIQAFNDFLGAYTALAPQPGDVCTTLTGTLAGVTLSPGVYCFDAAATLTGVLTLNGPSNGIWLFKIGTKAPGALTGTNFSVVMAGGGDKCNVTWWVDAAATMTTSNFQGNILAGAAITTTGGTFNGNAYSKADVTITGTTLVGCGAAGSPPCKVSRDRVTGGGWIRGPSGTKATFAVGGGTKRDGFRGHLQYNGRRNGNGLKVKGTGVTAYTVIDGVTRHIEGTARVNGQRGFTYQVDVSDNGEPGRNDVFAIRVLNASGALVYSASGTLRGGNIQLHKSQGRACKDRDGDDGDDGDDDGDDEGDNDGDDGDNDNPLGAAGNFAILGNAAVTCTDGTVSGNVGTFLAAPTGSVTQTTCPITGTVHVGDAAAIRAYNDFLGAYTALAPKPGDVCPIMTGTLAGQNLAPGVYCVSAEAKTGVLTLTGPANGTWTFKVAPGAFTGTSFSVVMAGGAQACNVTWWVDAAATMTDSDLKGSILAGAAVTLTRGTLIGRAFAKADATVTGTAVTGCVSGSGKGNHDGDGEGDEDDDDGDGRKGHHDKDKDHDNDKQHGGDDRDS